MKSSPSTELFFSPSTITVGVETNFTVNIQLVNCPPFNFFSITVVYNTTVLDTLNAQVLIPWMINQTVINENLGKIDFSAVDFGQALEGNQTLAAIELQPVMGSNSTLALQDTEIADSQLIAIPHNVTDCDVEIVGPLEIDVVSIQQSYYLEQNVTLHGNLTVEGIHVNGLVGIEVNGPQGDLLLIRTTESDHISQNISGLMEISSFYPSDDQGNPKSSFVAGFQAYFTVEVINLSNETLPLLITVNVFDKYDSPFGYTLSQGDIASGTTTTLFGSVLIPPDIANGTAVAYANAYSTWPRNGGIPYCPEKSATFQIREGSEKSSFIPPQSTQDFQADYNLTFKLPLTQGLGNYSVFVTSSYKVQDTYVETLFFATLLCDFNDDGKVGPYDFARFSVAYGSTPEDPWWLPEADFDGNRLIGPYDFAFFALNYGKHV